MRPRGTMNCVNSRIKLFLQKSEKNRLLTQNPPNPNQNANVTVDNDLEHLTTLEIAKRGKSIPEGEFLHKRQRFAPRTPETPSVCKGLKWIRAQAQGREKGKESQQEKIKKTAEPETRRLNQTKTKRKSKIREFP